MFWFRELYQIQLLIRPIFLSISLSNVIFW